MYIASIDIVVKYLLLVHLSRAVFNKSKLHTYNPFALKKTIN